MQNKLLFIILLILLSACRSSEPTILREVKTDTLKIVQIDTIFKDKILKEYVYNHDSMDIKSRGDTIFVDRWHTKNIYKELHDSVYITKNDTCFSHSVDSIPIPVTVYKTKYRTPVITYILFGVFLTIAILMSIYITKKLS